ncbi:MAG TPA: hypothetical protein VKE88_04075, partial [Candidatus Nanoarchaeia archaeon]|nr:hypothetical protein [Candidatus Nanoarchaeia archaeon]
MTSGLLRLEDSVSVFDEVRVKKEGDLWRSIGLAEEFNSLPCKLRDGLASMQDVVSLFYKAYQK